MSRNGWPGERHYAGEFDWIDQTVRLCFGSSWLEWYQLSYDGWEGIQADETQRLFYQYFPRQIVDEPTLIKALEEKWIAGAGLDVYENEPVTKDNPLIKFDNVIMLSHSASYSDLAFSIAPVKIAQEAAES